MKKYVNVILVSFLCSCNDKGVDSYAKMYKENKEDYNASKDKIYKLLEKNQDVLVKYEVENTVKRFIEYQYSNDTTKEYIDSIKLSAGERSFCQSFMYDQDINYIRVYLDSTVYVYRRVFKGWTQIIIYKDGIQSNLKSAVKIDSNTYYQFIED